MVQSGYWCGGPLMICPLQRTHLPESLAIYPPGLPQGHTSDGFIWGAPLGPMSLPPTAVFHTRAAQMEDEEEAELSDEPTGKPADRPTDETAVKLIEGHPPDDELTEDHLPDDELAETITVKCPPSRQESPPGSAQKEDRVVIHASEDEMDHLC